MFKEAESRPDKIESTSNNVKVRKNSNIGEGLVTSLHPYDSHGVIVKGLGLLEFRSDESQGFIVKGLGLLKSVQIC